ncbi:hypothetical protein [Sorangium cellulosum]|uniref:Uncharacterized protein n=1 Tax=Sorangium cellulosum So0157-2 TaxID=1254432 RepID=S4Y882_SORCE|nr:hypothetical protein [Sorangium cellulosum]AGP41074.1 hypothetical protein SCE1572_45200 [Sorangium cellulosum So0157-2]
MALVAATPACDGGAEDAAAKEAAETGAIRAALTVGGLRHDVVAVHYKLVAVDATCGDAAIAETTSALEEEALPELAPPPGSRVHAGADGLFVVPPGVYRVCATPLSSDGIQNQGETGVDCGGPCAPCGGVSVYSFVDTPADDVGIKSLYDFFSSLGSVSSSQHILFEIVTNEGATAWCSENAAFYVDTYVAQANEGGGSFQSGPWNKYWRVADGPWSGPDTGQYWNYYAASCDESPYSWCAEWDLGGYRWAVMPHHTVTNGESYFDWSYSNGENWVVTIAVGDDRLSTCGF